MNELELAVEARTRDLSDANIIVRNSPAILYRLRGEPSLPLIYISHNITKLGYDPAALLEASDWVRQLILPEDQSRVSAGMARVLEKDAPGALDRIPHPHGRWLRALGGEPLRAGA